MSGSSCPKCGAEVFPASPRPGEVQVCSTCQAQAGSSANADEYQLAPPEVPEPPRPAGPPPRRQAPAQEEREPSFFCWPLVAVLAVTLPGMMCLCPLAMFFDPPKGFLILWGICLVFGGIFWFGFRFKKLTGEGMPEEAPWYLRGGLSVMLQLSGYVIQEPVIFGPPFSVFVLGLLLCLSPIFIPDLRHYFHKSPVAGAPPPTATAPAAAGTKAAFELLPQAAPGAPAVAKEPTLRELFAENPMVYLTDLAEFDVQPGACPIGKHGNLGNGSRIVVQGKERPNGLGMHPTNPPAVAKASYRIDRQRATLRGGVALNDTAESPWGAAVFAIHGDGKLLWKSPPIKSRGTVTNFQLDLEGVDVLELSVVAEVNSHYVHAVWVEPRLIKKPRRLSPSQPVG